jgi:hypothetical protein
MQILVRGLETTLVQGLRAGGLDAHGQPPLVMPAEGAGNPCRHCLGLIAEGQPKLVLAHRPFGRPQPYAETGPIFLHQADCPRFEGAALPPWMAHLQPALVRGYGEDDWIRYDTGRVVAGQELEAACRQILADPAVAYVHIRSKFNCFQCRVEKAG